MTPAKIHTKKELVMMETYIADFHTSFYIPSLRKLVFHLPRVRILGSNHFGNTLHEAFICHITKQDVLRYHDYSERVVGSFAHQIQSE